VELSEGKKKREGKTGPKAGCIFGGKLSFLRGSGIIFSQTYELTELAEMETTGPFLKKVESNLQLGPKHQA